MAKKKTGPKGPSKWTDEVIENLADRILITFYENYQIMIMEQLCSNLRIPVEYISRFSAKNKKFCQAVKEIEPGLTSRLFESGATGEINPTMAIMGLKNAGTKWRDKTEVDNTHQFPSGIKVNFVTSVSDGS